MSKPPFATQSSLAITSGAALTPERQQPLFARRMARSSAAGNTLNDATSIPAYKGDRTYRDRVSAKSPDFYKLRLLDESDISAVFRNQSSSTLKITALDAQGGSISLFQGGDAKFKLRPNRSESIAVAEIPAGTYYLKVSTKSDQSKYRLKIAIERSCGCN